MPNFVHLFTLALTTAAMTACAGAPEEELTLEQKLAKRDYRIVEKTDRIRDFRIDGWYYIDRHNVVFRATVAKFYLLTFRQRCNGIENAVKIGFSTSVGRVTRFDKVLVHDRSGFVEKCLIDEIHRLEKIPAQKRKQNA